jgi:hypothetical protein
MQMHARFFASVIVAALASGCSATPEKDVVRKAAIALTGSPETLTAVASLTMQGSGMVAGVRAASFTRVLTVRGGRMREEVALAGVPLAVTGIDGDVAYRVNADGHAEREPETAAVRRARLYHHPVSFLLAALSSNAKLDRPRVEGGEQAVDLTVAGGTYSLFVDAATGRPSRITSREGASGVRETSFGNYQTQHGYTLPQEIVERVDGQVVATWQVARQFAGWAIPLQMPKELTVASN